MLLLGLRYWTSSSNLDFCNSPKGVTTSSSTLSIRLTSMARWLCSMTFERRASSKLTSSPSSLNVLAAYNHEIDEKLCNSWFTINAYLELQVVSSFHDNWDDWLGGVERIIHVKAIPGFWWLDRVAEGRSENFRKWFRGQIAISFELHRLWAVQHDEFIAGDCKEGRGEFMLSVTWALGKNQ